MSGYTKLFGSIVDSTIWRESKDTKILWITMLAMADKNGVVEASVPGLADRARLTISETAASIKELSSPDPYSRTKDHEGRRIEEIDGGWHILNHLKYREKMSAEERREYKRKWDQKHRPDRPNSEYRDEFTPDVTPDNPRHNPTNPTHTEADTDTLRPQSPSPSSGGMEPKTPSSKESLRFAKIYNRRPTTEWSEKEIRAFKRLVKKGIHAEDLDTVSEYYASNRSREGNICRRDLLTFINNFQGEVDRANSWKSSKGKINGTHQKHNGNGSTRAEGTADEGRHGDFAGIGE